MILGRFQQVVSDRFRKVLGGFIRRFQDVLSDAFSWFYRMVLSGFRMSYRMVLARFIGWFLQVSRCFSRFQQVLNDGFREVLGSCVGSFQAGFRMFYRMVLAGFIGWFYLVLGCLVFEWFQFCFRRVLNRFQEDVQNCFGGFIVLFEGF